MGFEVSMNLLARLTPRRKADANAALHFVAKHPEAMDKGARMDHTDFSHVKEGDTVVRMISGQIPMLLRVKRVDDCLIWATREDWFELDPDQHPGNYWTFDRKTGTEEDEDLGWGVATRTTGSMLTRVVEHDGVQVETEGREL